MKLFNWISLSFAALFTTGCTVDIRPQSHHRRVYYDTWDYCEPDHGVYIEGFYSTHGYHGHHGHRDGGYGYSRRHCR